MESNETNDYSYSTDQERYTGSYSSFEETVKWAKEELEDDLTEEDKLIWVGKNERFDFKDFAPNAYRIIEWMQERSYDELGEHGESFLDEFQLFSKEKKKEIDKEIYSVLEQIFSKHGIKTEPTGWRVYGVKEVLLKREPQPL